MLNSTDRLANEKLQRDAQAKAARRAEEASIVSGLRAVLDPDEQLLGFARGCIAGGIKGRLNIGPEAFFAPFVNIGLTERRVVLQHLHGETGRPSEILPHFFAIGDIQTIHFADIETYGGAPACRLVLHLSKGQNFRIRLVGDGNFASARALADVFRSLTAVRAAAAGPTQRVCSSCKHVLDRASKFCPYCGSSQVDSDVSSEASAAAHDAGVEKVTLVVTETQTDLLDDALAFLRAEPAVDPTADGVPPADPDPAQEVTMQPDATAEPEQPAVTEEQQAVADDPPFQPTSVDAAASPEPQVDDSQPPMPEGMIDFSAQTAQADASAHPPPASQAASESLAEASGQLDPYPVVPDLPTVHSAVHTHTTYDFASSASDTPPAPPEAVKPIAETEHLNKALADPEVHAVPTAAAANPFARSEPGYQTTNVREEAPVMPGETSSSARSLCVHFHIDHPQVKFDERITGRDADDVVAQLKDRVVAELKFPVKLAAMRLSPFEFAQELVMRYNQEERQSLPRPNSCREFLHLAEAIGYATVESD